MLAVMAIRWILSDADDAEDAEDADAVCSLLHSAAIVPHSL
jgi:hypothetical protein